MRANTEASFKARYHEADGHWCWHGAMQFSWKGTLYKPARIAWWLVYGKMPEHPLERTCDNATCIFPGHRVLMPLAAKIRALAETNRKDFCPKGHPYTKTYYPPACGAVPGEGKDRRKDMTKTERQARDKGFTCQLRPKHIGKHRYGSMRYHSVCPICRREQQRKYKGHEAWGEMGSLEYQRSLGRLRAGKGRHTNIIKYKVPRWSWQFAIAGTRYYSKKPYFPTEQAAYEAGQQWWNTVGITLFEEAYGEPFYL